MTSIYIIKDPRNNSVRYVGQTIRKLKHRLIDHYTDRSRKDQAKRDWLFELKDLGLWPIIECIETVEDQDALIREAYWIEYYGKFSALLNMPIGRPLKYGCPTKAIRMPVKMAGYVKEYLKTDMSVPVDEWLHNRHPEYFS
jgi:hypothetical protein